MSRYQESPTERQIAYAKDIGITIPDNASKGDISDLIDAQLAGGKLATIRHRNFATCFSLEIPRFIGKKQLFDLIHSSLSVPGREKELVQWFAFRIFRNMCKGDTNVMLDTPSNQVFVSIADQVYAEVAVIKSIRRYVGRELIFFGKFTQIDGNEIQGGSTATIAYKRIAPLVRGTCPIPARTIVHESNIKSQGKQTKPPNSPSILFWAFIAVLIFSFVLSKMS